MRTWFGSPLQVLLIAAVASGCTMLSPLLPRGDSPPKPAIVPSEIPPSSGSDRLRAGPPQETITPRQLPASPGTQPSESPQPARSDDPDPRAVIDWLLKEKPR